MENMSQVGLLILLAYSLLMAIFINNNVVAIECLASDHEALIDFKNGLNDSHNRLSSWRNTNCCQWHGIYCNNITGSVVAIDLRNPHPSANGMWNLSGELRPSLMKLKSLTHLDLSFNTFKGTPIPKFFGSLMNLQYLNLSNAGFSGLIPPQLGNLSHLQSLDLKNVSLHVENLQWLAGLVSLKHLDMDGVNLSLVARTDWVSALNQLPSLMKLHLSFCQLSGHIPSPSSLNFTSLTVIDLSSNQFVSRIPDWLVNISTLQHIDISNSGLYGKIPLGLRSLPKLQYLSLEDNYNLIANCSQLFMKGWERLQVLLLGSNKLNGTLPSSFGNLTSLTHLDLSSNHLTGMVTEYHFSKLSKLKILVLSSNSFTLNVTTNWLPPFQVSTLGMSSCVMGPSFPLWLKSQSKVVSLDFSNASIVGSIPNWFWHFSSDLRLLNMSHNELHGWLPNPMPMAVASPVMVDLSFNLLDGPLPVITPGFKLLDLSYNRFSGAIPSNISQQMSYVSVLSLSHNQLHGEIPSSFGEMLSAILIDLSGNNLTGEFPPSLANCSYLDVLDLGNNNLFGTIPSSLGKLKVIRSLHLNNNNFSGDLPSSLRNLLMLETMDLGYNRLSGIIPSWFGECFPFLRILILRSNAFSGDLSPKLSKLGSLQVLDLARNYLTGRIPASLGNLKAIAQVDKKIKYLVYGVFGKHYYEESLILVNKNQTLKYTKTISLVTSIDLSDNNFTGDIPIEITKLYDLMVLNLSRNHLTGEIPETMSNLLQLTSLDLSSNQLSGTIPSGFSSLSFLGSLDLSNNNLFGVIPYTGQLTTFDAISFAGNRGLCGPPLHVKCSGDGDSRHDSDKGRSNNDLLDNWFYLSLGLGFATGVLVPYFILRLKSSWCDVYFYFVDRVIDKLLRLTHKQKINHGQSRKIHQGQ